MFFRDRLVCFADFTEISPVALFFLLPPPNCFLRVWIPTLSGAVLKFFNHYQHLHFLAEQTPTSQHPSFLHTQKGKCGSTNNMCKCTKTKLRLSSNTSREWNLYLSCSDHFVTFFKLEMNVGVFSK